MRREITATGIPADAVATEPIGAIQAHKFEGHVTVLAVVVEQEAAADADWNIELAGNDLFGAEQSVAAADTLEEFIPGQNQDASDDTAVRVSADVSAASGTAGSELNVSVLYDDGR